MERPQRHRRLQVRNGDGPDAELRPLARTSGVTRSTGLPSASRVIVVPSALLLWKPVPALT